MKRKLEQYVGRIVRLNNWVFQDLKNRAMRQGQSLENIFLVAGVSLGVHQLICYSANFRVLVGMADVALI